MTLLFFYALADEQGPAIFKLGGHRLSGACVGAAVPGGRLEEHSPSRREGASASLSADVVVVGSGAGGGVIATHCAGGRPHRARARGGQYRNEADFDQLELPGYQNLYYGGGLAASEDGSISILAGQALGGGTVVNYMNCIRTPEHILRDGPGTAWRVSRTRGLRTRPHRRRARADQRQHRGDHPERHHRRLMAGLDELGYDHRPIVRNAALDDDLEVCGYCTRAAAQGCKRSVMKTWLQDASDAGARCVSAATLTGSSWRTAVQRGWRPP